MHHIFQSKQTALQAWLGEIFDYAQDDVVVMLLGNKCDSSSDRVIKKEEGERLSKVRCLLILISKCKKFIRHWLHKICSQSFVELQECCF